MGKDFYDNKPALIYHYFHQSWEDRLFKIKRNGKDINGGNIFSDKMEIFKNEIEGKYIYLDNSMIIKKKELEI